MMKVTIKTYGCKVNQYESQLLRENLEKSGYQLSGYQESQLVVVNTCCVTQKAESEAIRFVKSSMQDGKKVWLTGCGVKKEGALIKLPGVQIFDNKDAFINLQLAGADKITKFYKHTRAFVKIEDGCENFCSYCIIPYVRGPVKSRRARDIIWEVENLVDNGYQEIVLTGVDLGAYGKDTGEDFVKLLESLSHTQGIQRIRLSSIEMFHLGERLIDYLSGNGFICPHLHIPLQSGSDSILAMMKRRYTVSGYLGKLERIRKKIAGVTFTTDAMVGFPGEKEEDFKKTCSVIQQAGFLKVHIFRYSIRQETSSYRLAEHIGEVQKKEREYRLKEISEKVSRKIKTEFIGDLLEVLVEKKTGKNFYGYSSNYIPVCFSSETAHVNEIVKVKAEKLQGKQLLSVAV